MWDWRAGNRGTPLEDALPAIAGPYGLSKDVQILVVINPVIGRL
jgi:hypothetical protein